jgi:predicted nucleotidyltransferase
VPTARSEDLRALARRFTQVLPDDVDEALLTGSVSRGEADELSGIEMLLVARDTPFEGEVLEMAGWTHALVEGRLEGVLSGEMIDHTRCRFAEPLEVKPDRLS